ncbi:MAG TPA: sigma-70 family RNA polymerase sigma factor [Rhodothermales bacterium]|nr:sigma-70 family RNA polymerase sigma factor [Rhodothermales bacterium]
MSIGSEWHGIRDVAAHLPFELDDTEEANRAFQRWRKSHRAKEKRIVDLWTYCFVRRYFVLKFAQEDGFRLSDLDDLIARTYRKIDTYVDTVKSPGRYAHWVSKVCKNTFLNHTRTHRYVVPLQPDGPELVAEPVSTFTSSDFGILSRELSAAIGRLPEFLQAVARMRFIEHRSYEEIGRATGKSLPVIRSYTSKIAARFRRDRHLRAFLDPTAETSPRTPPND